MWSSALSLLLRDGRSELATGLRLSKDRGAGVCSTVVAAERGLDPVLVWLFGLNEAACGLGRNSLLLGFNLPPCALATPLDRREKLGSIVLDGPVGGSRASWAGAGFKGA